MLTFYLIACSELSREGEKRECIFLYSQKWFCAWAPKHPEDRFSFCSFCLLWWHLISTTKCNFSSQSAVSSSVGEAQVFTCFTLAANCFSPSPFDSHQTLSCSKRFDYVRIGALIILWIVYVFMYSPSVNGFCVLLSHELPDN